MSKLGDIRAGIGTQLGTVTGLSIYAHMPKDVNFPAVAIIPESLDFDAAMQGGLNDLKVDLFVMVSVSGIEGERQSDLDELIDPSGTTSTSVVAALRSSIDLGITGLAFHVDSWSGYGASYSAAGTENIGVIVHCLVSFTEA